MRRRFVTLDVFTDRRFTGNPLAVVHDAENLETATMQAIAREFGHPETVFVLPADDAAHRARLRIFTPGRELAFAGHPTVGTAVSLALVDGGAHAREMVFGEGIGPVRCAVAPLGRDHGHASFAVPKLPEELGPPPKPAALASALGIAASDIGFASFEPGRWSAGNPFVMVPLVDRAALDRCRIVPPDWDAAFNVDGADSVYMFCRETAEPGRHYQTRMFAPALGVAEDPATGSAAAAFAGVLARSAGLGDGDHMALIEQGYAMGRPSLIELTVTLRDGQLAAATVGGAAVTVTEGHIEA
ncbi:MAG TPA: PhzF family phenazine biosynthesis protein [Rhizomicrobium sp.]